MCSAGVSVPAADSFVVKAQAAPSHMELAKSDTVCVSFTDDYTSWSHYIDIPKGSKIGKLPKYHDSDYKFLGWYTKKNGGKKVSSNTVVNKSILLHAHLKALPIKVSFNANKGAIKRGSTRKTVKAGKAIGKLPIASRKGYVFLGWYEGAPKTSYWSTFRATPKERVYGNKKRTVKYSARWVKRGKGSTVTLAEWGRFLKLNNKGIDVTYKAVCKIFGGKGDYVGTLKGYPAYRWYGPSSYGHYGYNKVTLAFYNGEYWHEGVACTPFHW